MSEDRTSSEAQRMELLTDPETRPMALRFIKNLRNHIHKLQAAVALNDREQLRSEAHSLAGAASSFGYPSIYELAATLSVEAESISVEKLNADIEALFALAEQIEADPQKSK